MINYELQRQLEAAAEIIARVYNASERPPQEAVKIRNSLYSAKQETEKALELLAGDS